MLPGTTVAASRTGLYCLGAAVCMSVAYPDRPSRPSTVELFALIAEFCDPILVAVVPYTTNAMAKLA